MRARVFSAALRVDDLGHRLKLPRGLQEPLCFLADLACGLELRYLAAEWWRRHGR